MAWWKTPQNPKEYPPNQPPMAPAKKAQPKKSTRSVPPSPEGRNHNKKGK